MFRQLSLVALSALLFARSASGTVDDAHDKSDRAKGKEVSPNTRSRTVKSFSACLFANPGVTDASGPNEVSASAHVTEQTARAGIITNCENEILGFFGEDCIITLASFLGGEYMDTDTFSISCQSFITLEGRPGPTISWLDTQVYEEDGSLFSYGQAILGASRSKFGSTQKVDRVDYFPINGNDDPTVFGITVSYAGKGYNPYYNWDKKEHKRMDDMMPAMRK